MNLFVMLMKQRNQNRRGNQHHQERHELNKQNKQTINIKFLNTITFSFNMYQTSQDRSRREPRQRKEVRELQILRR